MSTSKSLIDMLQKLAGHRNSGGSRCFHFFSPQERCSSSFLSTQRLFKKSQLKALKNCSCKSHMFLCTDEVKILSGATGVFIASLNICSSMLFLTATISSLTVRTHMLLRQHAGSQ